MHAAGKKILTFLPKTIFWIVLIVILLVSSIYVVPFQQLIVKQALKTVNSDPDMEVKVKDFALTFPLTIDASGVEVYQRGDTMLLAGGADVKIGFWPLLKGEVEVKGIALDDIFLKMGAPDSALYLRGSLNSARLNPTTIKLSDKYIDLGKFEVSGADIDMIINPDTTPPTPPEPGVWRAHASELLIKNVNLRMQMLPTFDSINVDLPELQVTDAIIDLVEKKVNIHDIAINGVNAALLTPATPQPEVPEVPDPYPTEPMAIAIDHVGLTNSQALYGVAGAVAQPGLDFNRLQFTEINIEVDSVYSRGSDMRVDLTELKALTSTGMPLNLSGKVRMDSIAMKANDFVLTTTGSRFSLNALVGMGSDPAMMPVDVDLDASIAPADIQNLFPDMADIIGQLPKNRDIELQAIATGSMARLNIDRIALEMEKHFRLEADGQIKNVTDSKLMAGTINLDGEVIDLDFVKRATMDRATASTINIPRMKLTGKATINGSNYGGTLKALTGGGSLALDGSWQAAREGYNVDLNANNFPVNAFMPGLGIGTVTAHIAAKGQGLDFMSNKAQLSAQVDATRVVYNRSTISDLSLKADIANGMGHINLNSGNPIINAAIDGSGNLAGDTLKWHIAANVPYVDLQALGMSDSTFNATAYFDVDAAYAAKSNYIEALLNLHRFNVNMGSQTYNGTDVALNFLTNDSITSARLTNHDLALDFNSTSSLDSIMAGFTDASTIISKQIEARQANLEELGKVLPQFNLTFKAGQNNILYTILADQGTTFQSVELTVEHDSIFSVNALAKKIISGSYNIDDLVFTAQQNGPDLDYRLKMDNQPGTMDNFAHVDLSGSLNDNRVSATIEQRNINNQVGFHIGASVALSDSNIVVTLGPEKPIIDYRPWTLNPGNYIELDLKHHHIHADLAMTNGESSLKVFTVGHNDHDEDSISSQEKIHVDIKNMRIEEWISLDPFAPPIKGGVSANLEVGLSENSIDGDGTVTIADLYYGKQRVGTFDLGLNVGTRASGAITGKAILKVDDRQVMDLSGRLNDSTQLRPFLLDLNLTRFPLSVANPFIGAKTGSLAGYLNGQMEVEGSLTSPKFNGFLQFDSARIDMKNYGVALKFSPDSIAMDSNVVVFDNYKIFAANANPLAINGFINLKSLSEPRLKLKLDAEDMQIISAKKQKSSEIYGNAFIDLHANASGSLRFVKANAKVIVLPGTNVTYVMQSSPEELTSRSSTDMVRFVNFADTAAVEKVDTIAPAGMLINLDAQLLIAQGSTIGVDISSGGSDRAELKPNGSLNFSMDYMGDTHLTGRLNIPDGYVRYSPPLLSRLDFKFIEGSYVNFNGQMMNPNLNIHLEETKKANVTQEGQNSRIINFLIGLGVTGTLENMDVAFDLSTDDDITVSNELQSMTAEQRANQAMNLLLYNTYTGPGTKASSSLSGNPLYSFLASQVNSWMANNVKGVDISFGFDQYDNTVNGSSSTTQSYSYKVSKSFLNDKFKIVVGGNYTTDADPDENLQQNLINDIAFEYMLNRSGSMYLKLFRHTGYESILEGEVTQTGVGFVYKRKLNTLRNMFRFRRPQPAQPQETLSTPDQQPAVTNDEEK